MQGRNQQGDYRYAYQGQEKDPETGWEAFELRIACPETSGYDGRVGRWMTTDPPSSRDKPYSQYHSPYLAMGNNPVKMIDPDGGFAFGGGDPPLKVMMIDGQKIYYDPNIVATIKSSPISSNSSNTLDYIQLALDIGGSTEIPVVSQFADFSSGTISLFRGN